MDTVIGFIWGWICVIMGIYIGGGYDFSVVTLFIDWPSVFITIGGAMAALMIAHPYGDWKPQQIIATTMKTINYPLDDPAELIKKLVRYAELARKNGILALDGATDPQDDPFMVKGIQLAVDGIDPDQIKETMETELANMAGRPTAGKRFWANLTKYAPAYGMVGTLIGLVIMLKNLSDVALIGPSMAVALITTFYGALLANLVGGPMADKLVMLHEAEAGNKAIIISGVLSIQSGDNPRMVEQKLMVYLAPKDRTKSEDTK